MPYIVYACHICGAHTNVLEVSQGVFNESVKLSQSINAALEAAGFSLDDVMVEGDTMTRKTALCLGCALDDTPPGY